jgi:hypothetical protein
MGDVPAADQGAPAADNTPPGVDKAATALAAGLTGLTASLGAVGGLTGGIARMFRNSGFWSILLAVALVLASVAIATTVRLATSKTAAHLLVLFSTILFGTGAFWSMSLMVAASRTQDRPTLSAQLVQLPGKTYMLKVQTSSSGLDANDQLQLLVYAQPGPRAKVPGNSPTPSGSLASAPTSAPMDRATVRPSRVPAPRLDGIRLFFSQAGPNIDGVASQSIEVPIPAGSAYDTIIITASLGEVPRDCEGTTVNVRYNTELLVPPADPSRRDTTLSCVTVARPPTS